ncbi:MAG: NAD(P)/FAD-dependent oxidoreductase [Ignavibacteriae bacterium]|nr:MAG: NAD(P)/FAD-dependent oxidoreductase [Ignavibacteriota bacterium]
MKTEDVIIIGAGPAGLSCALQLSRYGIDPLLFEKDEIGGLLLNANLVENYIGFPGGISGAELVHLFKIQVSESSIRVLYNEVTEIEYENELFRITTSNGIFQSRLLVLAAGTIPKKPADLNFPPDTKDKIFYDILPIINTVSKNIIIVGAGDLAFDYALTLGEKNKIIMMNRTDKIRCIPLLKERVKNLINFTYCGNTELNKITFQQEKLFIEVKNNGSVNSICADYLVFAIGREPNRGLITDSLKEMLIKSGCRNNFFEIGDAANDAYRQTAIAAGDGIKAAMKIYQVLNEE